MARPGIMVYFEILESIRELPLEDIGRLTLAMLEYGQDGVVPKLEGSLVYVWPFVRKMIDKDEQRYDDMKVQREYAAFCKKRKRIWMSKISFDEWVVMSDDERQRAVDPVASRYPTTTTSTSTSAITADNCNEQLTTNSKQLTTNNEQLQSQYQTTTDNLHLQGDEEDGDGGEESKVVRAVGGTLGKGVVFMSDEQVSDLLDRMGIEAFDHYVDKLSDFIIKNGARVKSHYETILKWWKEDSSLR